MDEVPKEGDTDVSKDDGEESTLRAAQTPLTDTTPRI